MSGCPLFCDMAGLIGSTSKTSSSEESTNLATLLNGKSIFGHESRLTSSPDGILWHPGDFDVEIVGVNT